MPRDAEAWLAERGVERHALKVRPPEPEPEPDQPTPPAAGAPGALATPTAPAVPAPADPADPVEPGVTEPRAIESARVAEAAADERELLVDLAAAEPRHQPNLSDDVARAVAYIRNATSRTPMAEGRLRKKLTERDFLDPVVRMAIEQARSERLVDDHAFAGALVKEWQERGHAPRRIRDDLRKREFDDVVITEVMAQVESPDPEAAAFAVARERADGLSGLSPETAYRRLVAYLARRGHSEGLARKVARQVLWVEREAQQTAGH